MSAPWTERPPHALTCTRMLSVPTWRPSTLGDELKPSIARFAGGVRPPMLIVPVPAGHPVGGGGAVAGATTAVGAEVSAALPSLFVARTWTRSVWPTSCPLTSYRRAVAPLMPAQLPPVVLHRCHWYANESG